MRLHLVTYSLGWELGGWGGGGIKLCVNNFAGKPLRKRSHCRQRRLWAGILLQNQQDVLLSFIFENNLYMFRIDKLFIIRRWSYRQRLVCITHTYTYRLAVVVNLFWLYRVVNSVESWRNRPHTCLPVATCFPVSGYENCQNNRKIQVNLQEPCVLYIGRE